MTWGVHLSVSYLFCLFILFMGFSRQEYWSDLHSFLQWTTFCQNSPPRPFRLGLPYMAWLSFIEWDKAVVHVIKLVSFLWLRFQSVCSLMPSLSTYVLTAVSLSMDMGYLFTVAPAKCSHCSLLWMWGISSWPPLLTLDMGCLWKREWQTTSVFLPWEPHEQYEKAKKIGHWKMNSPSH